MEKLLENKHVPTEGVHILLELRVKDNIDFKGDKLKEFFLKLLEKSNATIIDYRYYIFPNEASSGVFLLAESHLSWHYWIDENYVSLDVYTCGNSFNHDIALLLIKEKFFIDDIKIFRRGVRKRNLYKIENVNAL